MNSAGQEPQPQPSVTQLEQVFEAFNRVSLELDNTYRELESKVAGLSAELNAARSARLKELAEKERLANRLSSLLAVLPGGVLILDSRQVIRDVNPEAVQLLGLPLVGQPWSDVILREARDDGASGAEVELANGKRISITSRRLDQSGDQVVLITDVSEIHHLQEQLGRRKRLTALGEMAARLAHQVRTPLSAASLYLSQLSRHDLGVDQRQAISAKVSERLRHMSHLLESMLSFVRGESPVSERIYLNQVLADFEASVRPQMEARGAVLRIPAVDNSLALVGDLDELVGAFSNLAINALDASQSPVELDVWVGALSPEWLQLRFRDNGPGINEDIIDRIFDPFFTTKSQGTGLGLAVVAMTVSNHGGEIQVNNLPQGGAEFVITLPIARIDDLSADSNSSEEK